MNLHGRNHGNRNFRDRFAAIFAARMFATVAFAADLLIAGVLIMLLFVPGGSAQTIQFSPQTALRFSLEGRPEGPNAIFLVPQDRGFYGQEGLDLNFDEAVNATETITRVASGSYDLGLADFNALIRFRDQRSTAPVTAIFIVYNRPAFAVVARKSRGVLNPKLLEGKKLATATTSASFGEWPLFAKLNGIDAAKVSVEQVGAAVRIPMLAAGQVDATLGFTFRDYVDLIDRGVPADDIVLMPMADFGLKAYGSAIIVNNKVATEKPEAVKGFVRALMRGIRETVRNPASAVDSVLKREDMSRKEIELERLRMAIRDNLITPEVRANGYGAIDPARFEEMISQMALVYPFKAKPRLEDVFDGQFLPRQTDRGVN